MGQNGAAILSHIPIIGREPFSVERWFVTVLLTGQCSGDEKHTLMFAGGIGQTTVCDKCRRGYTLLAIASNPVTNQIEFAFDTSIIPAQGQESGTEPH